ncbi:Rossmann-like domain-containing protein [Halobellus salinisoli]|uniref:Rossmann-like domain-containing protein n=1 Tax=Halobellus salinisoli TaxID=3108500 RepID=UPI003009FE65
MTELLAAVRERLRPQATRTGASVDRITVGDRAVLVELRTDETTLAGLAHLPPGEPPNTANRTVESLLAGVTADVGGERTTPADGNAAARSERALGTATMNALSAPLVDWRRGDPMALLSDDVGRIATVGLFTPAFRKFDDIEVRVIERERVDDVPDPAGVRVRTFTPADTASAMTGAEVVFVTGSTFIYGGIEAYLEAAPTSATVVVIGATASFLPEPLFAAGVDVVAGARVTDVAGVRTALREGACGTDLHDAGLTKVYVARENDVARESQSGLLLGERPPGGRLDSSDEAAGADGADGADGATTDEFSPTTQR